MPTERKFKRLREGIKVFSNGMVAAFAVFMFVPGWKLAAYTLVVVAIAALLALAVGRKRLGDGLSVLLLGWGFILAVSVLAAKTGSLPFAVAVAVLATILVVLGTVDAFSSGWLSCKWQVKWWFTGRLTKTALAGLAIMVTMLITAGSVHATTQWGGSGGIDWGHNSSQMSPLRGSNWVDVHHNGHYPIGAFKMYEFHMKCTWRYHVGGGWMARPRCETFTRKERIIEYQGVIERRNYYYRCDIQGRIYRRGCYYAFRKAKIKVLVPIKGEIAYAYPWVAVKFNNQGEILWWDWSGGML